MGDRQRVADRHRRIDGVAALAQNIHADAGGQASTEATIPCRARTGWNTSSSTP
jgi:hypothetical protein